MSDARLLLRLLLPPSSSSPDLICRLLIAVGLAGLHLPGLDHSGPRRTSSASSWSQWASPDLICQLLIAMVLAGLQPARVWALWSSPDFNRRGSELWASPDFNRWGSERCGPRRTSTGEGLSAAGLAGLQPVRGWALWALPDLTGEGLPDFNRRDSAPCGPRRTSTGEIRRAVGLAGL